MPSAAAPCASPARHRLVAPATGQHMIEHQALARVARVLVARLDRLEERLQAGEEDVWPAFLDTSKALAAVAPHLVPGSHGAMLSTRQMAERLGISPKTLLKRKAKGQVRPAVQLGQRGRAALRWRGDEAVSR